MRERYPDTPKTDLALNVLLAGIGLGTVVSFVLIIIWSLS